MNLRENTEGENLDLEELYRQVYLKRNIAIEHEQKGDICQAISTYQSILRIVEQNSRIFKKLPIWYSKKSEKQMTEMVKMYCSHAESKISVLRVFLKTDSELFASIVNDNHINKDLTPNFQLSKSTDHVLKDDNKYSSCSKKIYRTLSFQKQNDIFEHSLRMSNSSKSFFFDNIFKGKILRRGSSKEHLLQTRRASQPRQFPQTLRQTKTSSHTQNSAGKAALYAWNSGANSNIHSPKTNETNGNSFQHLNDSTIQPCSSLFSTSCRKSLHNFNTSKTFSFQEELQSNNHISNSQCIKNNIFDELSNPTLKQQTLFHKPSISIPFMSIYAPDSDASNTKNISHTPHKNISSTLAQKSIQNSLTSTSPNLIKKNIHEACKEQYINANVIKNQKYQDEITYIPDALKNISLESQNTDIKIDINRKEETREQRAINSLKGTIDENLLQAIVNDIVIKGDEVSWEDIAGLEEAKKALKETVIYPLLRPDLFNGLREPATGVLLFGPPGTGKTMLAKAAAAQAKSTFFSISASSLTSKFLGESEKLVRALFALAKELSPSIIFVDEIDAILSSRREDGNEHEASRRLKTEFLIQWSSLAKAVVSKEKTEPISRVLVLAATNIPWAIDEAARRRFVRRQYIPLPERNTRMQQVLHLLKYQTHTLSNEDIENLVDITEGYSGSDITALTKDAAMGPLRSLGEALLTTRQDLIRPISLDDFKASLRLIRPSVSKKGLIEFEKFNREFGIQN